jgi:hypothetical protein
MKKFFIVLSVLAAFGAGAVAAPDSVQASTLAATPALPKVDKAWEEISNDEQVRVHRKEIEGSDVVAFRGETVIEAPLAKVANVLIDTSRKLEWVHKIVEAKDIREISQYERVEYNHTASGFFMVRDRDFVFHAKAELDKPNQRMIFRLKSVEDPLMPETDKVRGHLTNSAYTLTALGDNQTHVVVEIHADPKGSVPKWLVNLFQKSWPRRTLNGIRAQCGKPDVVEHAAIRDYFALPAVPAVSAVAKKPVSKKATN